MSNLRNSHRVVEAATSVQVTTGDAQHFVGACGEGETRQSASTDAPQLSHHKVARPHGWTAVRGVAVFAAGKTRLDWLIADNPLRVGIWSQHTL